jgi:hypothetical protein
MKKTKIKNALLPDFDKMSLEEEALWWETHDLTDLQGEFETIEAKFVKPKSEIYSVRFTKDVARKLRTIARRKGVGTTTLVRMWTNERLNAMSRRQTTHTG